MKQFFLSSVLQCLCAIAFSQANTKLSNLVGPTAVNQSLLPGTTAVRDLGSSTLAWKDMYLRGYLYLDGERFVSNAPGAGGYNTFIGGNSAIALTTGKYNSTLGFQALYKNNIGSNNIGIGTYALYNNTYGYSNTAVGLRALNSNTGGFRNTGIGDSALFSNNTGLGNTATGYQALYHNTTGEYCVAQGYQTLYKNTTGHYNVAIGYHSIFNNTSNNYNTAIGIFSGYYSSAFSTFLGAYAYSNNGVANATAIGYGAFASASNLVRVGNSSVTSIGGQVNWTTFSDGRYKQNIKQDVHGLDFINSLNPITYTVNVKGLKEWQNKFSKAPVEQVDAQISQEEAKAEAAASKIVYSGFVAQEVEEVAKKLGYDFSGIDKPQNSESLYGLRYADFVVPLVKAVQELDSANKAKDKQISSQQKQIDELRQMVLELKNGRTNTVTSSAYLEQNTPNPVTGTTSIRYHIAQNTMSARLNITNAKGQLVKTITITNKGIGNIDLNTAMLASGTYNYTLYVDGKQVETKRLVVAR